MHRSAVDEVDVETLIEEVKQQPTIWDVQSEGYKDRLKKHSAWVEVCRNLFEDFGTKSKEERNMIIRTLALKWKNIKDNNLRNIRRRGKTGRKYIYSKHLTFLNDSIALAASRCLAEEPNSASRSPEGVKIEESYSMDSLFDGTPGSTCPAGQQLGLESSLHFISSPDIVNSNRSFFESLIPMIQGFTEDQTLQFRSEVIDLVRKMKRQYMSDSHTTISIP